jgi:hypothetical protein
VIYKVDLDFIINELPIKTKITTYQQIKLQTARKALLENARRAYWLQVVDSLQRHELEEARHAGGQPGELEHEQKLGRWWFPLLHHLLRDHLFLSFVNNHFSDS